MPQLFWRACSVIMICLLLISCSSRTVYNNLNWLSDWYIDDYVTLSDQQEEAVRLALTSFLQWHRGSELPRYRAYLAQFKAQLNQSIDESAVLKEVNVFRGFWHDMVVKASPDLVRLAGSMSAVQVSEWMEALEERNLEHEKKLTKTSAQDQLSDRQRRIEAQLKKILGTLSAAQKDLVGGLVAQLQPTTQDWLVYRRSWAAAVQDAFVYQQDTNEFARLMMACITQSSSWYTQAYQKKLEHNQRVWAQAVPRLLSSLTQKQKDKLNHKIDDVLYDLDVLIGQGGKA